MFKIYLSIASITFLCVSFFFIFDANCSQLMADKHLNFEQLGQRIYREGILPNGEIMQGFINGDVAVDSSAFSCSSCHMRAGLGSVEGGIVTPPTNGRSLYKPYRRPPSLEALAGRAGTYDYAKTIPSRPAYTRETLAHALRFGVDPAGQTFNNVMPRYPLSDSDMNILINYLDKLSSEYSPGVTASSFAFATIITDDVNAEDRKAMLAPLERFVAGRNQQIRMYQEFIKMNYTPTVDMKYSFHNASLAVWHLKGAPDTWPAQLQAYYDKQPVFAVLGGISNSSWKPIHDFCESMQLPCLYPITNFPVVSETGWYTFYFNKGYYQEGEAAAVYLNRMESIAADTPILQIVQDSAAGKTLAEGFEKTWGTLGRPPVKSLVLEKKQLLDKGQMSKILKENRPAVFLLWADGEVVPALSAMAANLPNKSHLFVSATQLGKATADIPENLRKQVYISFPYRLTPFVGSKESFDAKVPILTTAKNFGEKRITSRIETMLQHSVLQGIKLLYDNLNRDNLLDIMSMQMDQIVMDYERLSFGPGQRYTSKGCYIIQLGEGADPQLIPVSEWVMH